VPVEMFGPYISMSGGLIALRRFSPREDVVIDLQGNMIDRFDSLETPSGPAPISFNGSELAWFTRTGNPPAGFIARDSFPSTKPVVGPPQLQGRRTVTVRFRLSQPLHSRPSRAFVPRRASRRVAEGQRPRRPEPPSAGHQDRAAGAAPRHLQRRRTRAKRGWTHCSGPAASRPQRLTKAAFEHAAPRVRSLLASGCSQRRTIKLNWPEGRPARSMARRRSS
jgi:hypothetical protein